MRELIDQKCANKVYHRTIDITLTKQTTFGKIYSNKNWTFDIYFCNFGQGIR